MKRHIFVKDAPPPPPSVQYAHAIEAGGFLYVTGQLPLDPAAPHEALPNAIEGQARACFRNLGTILDAAGYTWRDAVFVRIYLREFARDYVGFNAVYHEYFDEPATMPGRTTVGVAALGRDALVEVDLVLYRDPGSARERRS